MSDDLRVSSRVVIPARELSWTAVRSGGPGGQNVNKVASKVELRFALATSGALTDSVKARVRALAGHRVDTNGELLITSQKTRDQSRNLEDAREKLRELIARALEVPKPRRATRPSRGSVERRLKEKKVQSSKKRDRRFRDHD